MSAQLLPALIMFVITAGITSVLCMPIFALLVGCMDIPDDDQCRRRRDEYAPYPRRPSRTDSYDLSVYPDAMFCYFRHVWLVQTFRQSHRSRYYARLE